MWWAERIAAVELILVVITLFLGAILAKRPLDLEAIGEVWGVLAAASLLTLLVTTLAYFIGMGLGFLIGWQRTSRRLPLRGPATIWVEAVRGTPLFVQLYLIFHLFSKYNPGDLDFPTRVFVTGLVALLLNTSAYQAEIFRAGFQSVPRGQIEAAHAVGLDSWRTMRHVVLPQALRVVVPPLVNEYVALLKASALLAVISLHELAYQAKTNTSQGQPWLEVYLLVTALYFLMIIPLTKIVGFVERRVRIPGVGMQPGPPRRPARRGRGDAGARGSTGAQAMGMVERVLLPHNVLRRRTDATIRPW
jgi:polar amino acid transport system permease protein